MVRASYYCGAVVLEVDSPASVFLTPRATRTIPATIGPNRIGSHALLGQPRRPQSQQLLFRMPGPRLKARWT
jgi:hypothetical protein